MIAPKTPPRPGSREALEQGCKCPVMDNEYGKGYMGIDGLYVYTLSCPLHRREIEKTENKKGDERE